MLYVFFVINHASRQVVHVHVTPHPTASWTAQQIVECCAWDRVPARFLVHDRDSCYGSTFDRRVRNIGIAQIRTPFRSPRANANRGALGEVCQDRVPGPRFHIE
jgi:hypothetical protein